MESSLQQLDKKLDEILDLQIEAWALSRQGKDSESQIVMEQLEKARDEYRQLSGKFDILTVRSSHGGEDVNNAP